MVKQTFHLFLVAILLDDHHLFLGKIFVEDFSHEAGILLLMIANCLAVVNGHDEMVEFWICVVESGPGNLGARSHLQVGILAYLCLFGTYQLWEVSVVWMVIVVGLWVCKILHDQDWSLLLLL
jgi:hypothetical protein